MLAIESKFTCSWQLVEMWMGETGPMRIPFYQLVAIQMRAASNARMTKAIDDIVSGFSEIRGTESEKLDWLRERLAAFRRGGGGVGGRGRGR